MEAAVTMVAEAVVNGLAETLTGLLSDNFQLISDAHHDVQKLLRCINGFKSILKESRKNRTENEIVKQLVKEIMDVVYRSENLIDQYVVDANIHVEKKLTSLFDFQRRRVVGKIKGILNEIKEIQEKKEYQKVIEDSLLPREHAPSVEQKVPIVEEVHVVGFDGEAKTIIQRLMEESSYEVISVLGMAGLGKTTLANKVFKSQEIEYHFMHRVWIYVSRLYKKKDVYLQILKKLQQSNDNDIRATEEELGLKIKQVMEHGKYLIVLDDVWTKETFEDIMHGAFPKRDGCKVLVTTRKDEVAMTVNSLGEPHRLKFLEPGESWELLENRVFHEKETCPDDLKPYGEEVAKKCGGLPLAIVIMAGVLCTKERRINKWREVANRYSYFFNTEVQSYEELIRLSYGDLPDKLKCCFLYLGAFPNGNDIPAAKLMQLWIAEGFIEEEGGLNMEDIACENLCGLVGRNLVMATQRKPDGEIKTCRVHDMLLQFCKKEAMNETLFNEINGMNQQQQGSSCRRLSVHCPFENFISSTEQKPELRSLLCFATSNGVQIPPKTIKLLRKAFPLLRVLHFAPDDSVIFTSCNTDFFRLFHLKYIAISTTAPVLPKEIENLQNVQTLIVRTTRPTLEIRGDIWNMSRLRHFQTNASANLPSPSASKTKRAPFANENLQTLSKVSPLSCTPAALAKASNIKKLGIRGTLAKLLEIDPTTGSSLFQNLGGLKKLVNFKLFNDGEKLQRLPREFPENLTNLTLSRTCLQWKELSVLGTLETLEILKLIERAAEGEYWEPIIGGFLYLQVLHIDRTDLRSWNASNKNFPRLRSLVLSNCEELEMIPQSLAHISSLQEIKLKHTKKAITSAQDILKQKQNPTQKSNRRFKLTIYPPLRLDHSQASELV
ncbi:PREDICTED: putative late blight resistance protein homolog R1B-14 [Ipomoea nil]|uniref:putative late blight resistance protein homolog R1B-14 n=1 Tax=Ipomoea nil TaxID=35883 RepID=UPI000900A5C8|nr:PREDICTED: putative late blight resistance protein homolog R1B-14 [Ipomoea nil]XP_019181312.1 PREDICTED: putative late blight resistance protein homolog R1B-14 [Ipomoea nil]